MIPVSLKTPENEVEIEYQYWYSIFNFHFTESQRLAGPGAQSSIHSRHYPNSFCPPATRHLVSLQQLLEIPIEGYISPEVMTVVFVKVWGIDRHVSLSVFSV